MDLSLHSLVFLFILSKWYFYKPIKKTLVWRQFLISGGEEMSLNHYVGEQISMNLSYMSFIYKGSRLLFNIIIYLQAYKRLPEFSGLMGNVYPGQLKPRFSIPEPRIKSPVSLEWKQIQNEFMEEKDNGLMPSQIIMVKQVSNSY